MWGESSRPQLFRSARAARVTSGCRTKRLRHGLNTVNIAFASSSPIDLQLAVERNGPLLRSPIGAFKVA